GGTLRRGHPAHISQDGRANPHRACPAGQSRRQVESRSLHRLEPPEAVSEDSRIWHRLGIRASGGSAGGRSRGGGFLISLWLSCLSGPYGQEGMPVSLGSRRIGPGVGGVVGRHRLETGSGAEADSGG